MILRRCAADEIKKGVVNEGEEIRIEFVFLLLLSLWPLFASAALSDIDPN